MNDNFFKEEANAEEIIANNSAPRDISDDLLFRCIAVEQAPHEQNVFRDFHGVAGADMTYKANEAPLLTAAINLKNPSSSSSSSRAGQANLQEPPFGIPATNFKISGSDYETLQGKIDSYLKNAKSFDFSYIPSDYMWKGKLVQGACCIECDVRVFFDKNANEMTVAVLKSKCDARCGAYGSFYDKFYEHVVGTPLNKKPRRVINMRALPANFGQPSDEEFLLGIEPVFKMAQEACMEPRLEAAKMLCDLSCKEAHFLELSGFRSDCLIVLESLMKDSFADVRQHTIMALGKFAEISSYQEGIIFSRMLPVMFALVDNCPNYELSYETAQIRRTASAVIELLSRTHAATVRAQLINEHGCDVDGWANLTVPTLRDNCTREFAIAAAMQLQCEEAVAGAAAALKGSDGDGYSASDLETLIR